MRSLVAALVLARTLLPSCYVTSQTQVWFGPPRSSNFDYASDADGSQHINSLPYANLTVRIHRSRYDGPGQNLVYDPLHNTTTLNDELYVGNTINRQTFETQFILDIQGFLAMDVNRIHIASISVDETVHFEWEHASVIVEFILIERSDPLSMSLIEAISELTMAVQHSSTSPLFIGNVTRDLDTFYGVRVVNWDVSLKLNYAIEVVSKDPDAIIDGLYLNQGGQGLCETPLLYDYPSYCEFERFFEDDVSAALNISSYRVQVLFVKKAALDAVLVHLRVLAPALASPEANISACIASLAEQVNSPYSRLYAGNVTLRVDATWGVSNTFTSPRQRETLSTHKHYELDASRLASKRRMQFSSAYDRCKANRRCNWGVTGTGTLTTARSSLTHSTWQS